MKNYDYNDIGEFVNVGTGKDITIEELARLIAEVIGFRGDFRWDTSKPNGTPRKLLDVSRLHALGWHARIPLQAGIEKTYQWYREHNFES